jgi:DNA-binding protein HU-beta
MNKSELIDAIAADAGITATAKLALESFLGNVSGTLKTGGRVSLVGFGSWSVSARAARDGRNPQTGKTIQIAAKNVVKFKAGAELEGAVIVSFKPIIIKPSLWKVFYVNDFGVIIYS